MFFEKQKFLKLTYFLMHRINCIEKIKIIDFFSTATNLLNSVDALKYSTLTKKALDYHTIKNDNYRFFVYIGINKRWSKTKTIFLYIFFPDRVHVIYGWHQNSYSSVRNLLSFYEFMNIFFLKFYVIFRS